MRPTWIALCVAIVLSARAGAATETTPVGPPDPAIPHALSPGADDEIRRLMKAAQGLREKASDLRMQAEAIRDDDVRADDDRADDLDERAEDLEEKAMRYEDDADEVRRIGEKPVEPKKPSK
jgi:hypothetical protein